ncbi:MAG: NAD(+)/NADH kinase [Acidimicrobiales bacterium]
MPKTSPDGRQSASDECADGPCTVALVLNHRRPRAVELARQAADWLAAGGHRVRVPDADAAAAGLSDYACPAAEVGQGAALAVSLGGDGTILRTLSLVATHEVPVLGVNLGRLGYLAHVEPDALTDALKRFVAGDHDVEERILLCVRVETGADSDQAGTEPGTAHEVAVAGTRLALNEAVVEKLSPGQVVHVAVAIDGCFFLSYAADGMIVATPTGSTAYAFSARGPIIAPTLRALLLSPVSPHMAFDRSLVFGPDQSLRLEVLDRPGLLIVDGQELGRLDPGASITCTAAPQPARFVTFAMQDFYGVLKAKFGLADR